MYLFETVCTIQVRAQGGGALVAVRPTIIAIARQQSAQATRGLGGALVWPGLLRRLARQSPGHDQSVMGRSHVGEALENAQLACVLRGFLIALWRQAYRWWPQQAMLE